MSIGKSKKFVGYPIRTDHRQEAPGVIRTICKKNNWNFQKLASILETSVYNISRWNTGKSSPNTYYWNRLKKLESGELSEERVSVKEVSDAAYIGVQAQILQALGEIKYRLSEIEQRMQQQKQEIKKEVTEEILMELEAMRITKKKPGKTFKGPTSIVPG